MNPKVMLEVILKKWSEMPQAVRVGTFIAFVASYFYLMFAPQYIDGQLNAFDRESNTSFPLQHQIFEMFVDGRSIRFVTDGRGRYAIPKPSKLPLSPVELSFFPEGMKDGSPEKKVMIPVLSAVSGRADILNIDGNYVIDDKNRVAGATSFFIPSAHAQDTAAAAPVTTAQSEAEVSREVTRLAQTLTEKPALDANSELQTQGMSSTELSKLLYRVENQYGVVVNTNRQPVRSIEDIATIVAGQQKAKSWQSVTGTSWLKPKGLFGAAKTLEVQNSKLKVQTQAVAEDSAEVVVFREEDGEKQVLLKSQMLPGESITVKDADKEYAIELEKVDNAGFDRFINPKAAYLNVKTRQPQ
ncbi:hypothetical protein [Microbulbifer hainanensis]|uniref:hypothetical protein n=1 Tax=Microbulbifer hainanensis TaxID=2735675 RepID=UPI00186794D3|nr:hypothetical protein [Microbulbifer hainanensis]